MTSPLDIPSGPLVFVHIEYQVGNSKYVVFGRYEVGKLLALSQFMADCISAAIQNRAAPELPPEILKEEKSDNPTPNALELKYKKFRESVKIPESQKSNE